MNEAPDNWTNPFGTWMTELKLENPEFFQFMNPEPITKIHVTDESKTYHLVLTPEGKRFIAQDKLCNAEALGLSVRRM